MKPIKLGLLIIVFTLNGFMTCKNFFSALVFSLKVDACNDIFSFKLLFENNGKRTNKLFYV